MAMFFQGGHSWSYFFGGGWKKIQRLGSAGGRNWKRRSRELYGCFRKWWVFPPNHPLKNRVFPLFSPSILGCFPIFGNTHIKSIHCRWKARSYVFQCNSWKNWCCFESRVWSRCKQGSWNYPIWGGSNNVWRVYKFWWIFLTIMHCLSWCHTMTPGKFRIRDSMVDSLFFIAKSLRNVTALGGDQDKMIQKVFSKVVFVLGREGTKLLSFGWFFQRKKTMPPRTGWNSTRFGCIFIKLQVTCLTGRYNTARKWADVDNVRTSQPKKLFDDQLFPP